MMTISNIRRRSRSADTELPRPPIDNTGGGGDDGSMDARIAALEVANLETRLTSVATREDLHKEINAQTWRLVTFVCSFGTALVAATYFVATYFS
jgi:hypothetical protein